MYILSVSVGQLRSKLEEEKKMRISLENQLEDLRERGGRETFSS